MFGKAHFMLLVAISNPKVNVKVQEHFSETKKLEGKLQPGDKILYQ